MIIKSTKNQARLIITEKVEEIRRTSVMVGREIKEIRTGSNQTEAIFHNGSKIMAVTSNENARG